MSQSISRAKDRTRSVIIDNETGKRVKKKKTAGREWLDAIVFAVIAATIIRTLFIEAYTIPTGSMERSLLIGDFLFVSKINYGARTPITPVAFPFAHHTMPITNTKAYWDGIQLPYYRLPGLGKIKRYDVVVFNWPMDTVNNRPVDKKENYIKRCQGLPGDTLSVVKAQVYVNGKASEDPPQAQTSYYVKTDGTPLNPKTMQQMGITGAEGVSPDGTYGLTLTPENYLKVKAFPVVKTITPVLALPGQMDKEPLIFPGDSLHAWNADYYGPIIIPAKGMTMALNTNNINIYRRAISVYERNKLEVNGDQILINGIKSNSYTFKMNYYWMMGDNRHNSLDSRYWGFVPEDHIVGKALFIWMSWDDDQKKIRWERLFQDIH